MFWVGRGKIKVLGSGVHKRRGGGHRGKSVIQRKLEGPAEGKILEKFGEISVSFAILEIGILLVGNAVECLKMLFF